jgi:hypothetical protein
MDKRDKVHYDSPSKQRRFLEPRRLRFSQFSGRRRSVAKQLRRMCLFHLFVRSSARPRPFEATVLALTRGSTANPAGSAVSP